MSVKQRHRTGNTAQVMLVTGVVISYGLTGCTQTPDLAFAAHTSMLSATQDSDVLAGTIAHRYELSKLEVSPEEHFTGLALPDAVNPSGYFVAGDGVITEAWLEANLGEALGEASFKLTEPIVLRPSYGERHDDGSVAAVGTLSFGGVDRPGTVLQFSVASFNDEHAELDVLVTPPTDLLAVANDMATVTARLSFNAS